MSIDAIRAKIDSLKTDKATRAVMYFLLKYQNQYELREVDLTPDTQSEVTLNTLHDISEFFEGEYALRDLTAADQREGVIYNYNLNEKPVQLELLEQAYNRTGQIIGFDHEFDSVSDLKAIILVLGNGVEKLAIYKFHFPTNIYRRSGFSLLRAGLAQDRFEKLEQDIIRVSHTVDFLFDGTSTYVTNFKILEKFFGFKEAIKAEAADQLNQLAQRDLIENIADLNHRITTLGDVTFSKKVIRAISHSPVLQAVSNQQIIQFVQQHHKLGKKIPVNYTGDKFVLNTKISQNFFMKLLNDDYLKSELTNFEYDADSKDIFELEEGEA